MAALQIVMTNMEIMVSVAKNKTNRRPVDCIAVLL